MKKKTRKMICILLMIVLMVPSMVVPTGTVKAKTLGDLKRELDRLEEEAKKTLIDQELTEGQMAQIKNNINRIGTEVDDINRDMKKMKEDITAYQVEIDKKDAEMKAIVHFNQISSGESAYLEYMFGASDFTDLIYRVAVSEQLANYNKKLIAEYHGMIEQNEKRTTELKEEQQKLEQKQAEMSDELKKLGSKLSEIADTSIGIDEDIKAQREIIQMYEDLNCKDDEDISICGKSQLPSETAFWRPMIQGYVTSEWGSRWGSFHEGIDISVSPNSNVPVYATGKGIVATTIYHGSCGGNMVLIHHNVNGHNYTSMYAHLRAILVNTGDYVDKDTQIGIMGGHADTTVSGGGWDSCSFGPHLHFTLSDGLYGIDYSSWDTLIAKSMNPRDLVNFAGEDEWFYNRTTKY